MGGINGIGRSHSDYEPFVRSRLSLEEPEIEAEKPAKGRHVEMGPDRTADLKFNDNFTAKLSAAFEKPTQTVELAQRDVVDLMDVSTMYEVAAAEVKGLRKDIDGFRNQVIEAAQKIKINLLPANIDAAFQLLADTLPTDKDFPDGKELTREQKLDRLATVREKIDNYRALLKFYASERLSATGGLLGRLVSGSWWKSIISRGVRALFGRDCGPTDFDRFTTGNPFSMLMDGEEVRSTAARLRDRARDLRYQLAALGYAEAERKIREAQIASIGNLNENMPDYYTPGEHTMTFTVEVGAAFRLAGCAKAKIGAQYQYSTGYKVKPGGEVTVTSTHYLGLAGEVSLEATKVAKGSVRGEGGYAKGHSVAYRTLRDAVENAPLDPAILMGGGVVSGVKLIWRKICGKTATNAARNVDNARFVNNLKASKLIAQSARCVFTPFNRLVSTKEYDVSQAKVKGEGKARVGVGIDGKVDGANFYGELKGGWTRTTLQSIDYKPIDQVGDAHSGHDTERFFDMPYDWRNRVATFRKSPHTNQLEIRTALRQLGKEVDALATAMRYNSLSWGKRKHLTVPNPSLAKIFARWGVGGSEKPAELAGQCLRRMAGARKLLADLLTRDSTGEIGPRDREVSDLVRDKIFRPEFGISSDILKSCLYESKRGEKSVSDTYSVSTKVFTHLGADIKPLNDVNVLGVKPLRNLGTVGVDCSFEMTVMKNVKNGYSPRRRAKLAFGLVNSFTMNQILDVLRKVINSKTGDIGKAMKADTGKLIWNSIVLSVVTMGGGKMLKNAVTGVPKIAAEGAEKSFFDALGIDTGGSASSVDMELSFVDYGDGWRLETNSVVRKSTTNFGVGLDGSELVEGPSGYTKFKYTDTSKVTLRENLGTSSCKALIARFSGMREANNLRGWQQFSRMKSKAIMDIARALVSDRDQSDNANSVRKEFQELFNGLSKQEQVAAGEILRQLTDDIALHDAQEMPVPPGAALDRFTELMELVVSHYEGKA